MTAQVGWLTVTVAMLALGCGGSKPAAGTTADEAAKGTRSRGLSGEASPGSDQAAERCDPSKPNREVSEYDTTNDGEPDLRKIYLKLGQGASARLVLICREVDLNHDGRGDVIRYFDNNGQPLKEEADQNFDGKIDAVTFFQERKVLRREIDSKGAGKVDTKVFFDNGQPLRAERDTTGRSVAGKWNPDQWEYYEDGRVVRVGTDTDGDGFVDHWDRDMTLHQGDAEPEPPPAPPAAAPPAAPAADEKKAAAKKPAGKKK